MKAVSPNYGQARMAQEMIETQKAPGEGDAEMRDDFDDGSPYYEPDSALAERVAWWVSVNCGHPRSEHKHSGACYGLCGEFVASQPHRANSVREALEHLSDADGCFEAALFEGLCERMAEKSEWGSGSLEDLVSRRLLPARESIQRAMGALHSPSRPGNNLAPERAVTTTKPETCRTKQGLWRRLTYPRALPSFFNSQRCPDCGGKRWLTWQDGGHDEAIECCDCGSQFGIQMPPFNMIERIRNGSLS